MIYIEWVSVNLFKINTSKKEFIMFGEPSHVSRFGETSVRVGNDDIKVTKKVRLEPRILYELHYEQ